MKTSTFIIVALVSVFLVAKYGFGILFVVLIAYLFIRFVYNMFKSKKIQEYEQEYQITFDESARLERPGDYYQYYNMVGMKYHNIKGSDMGSHYRAYAIADKLNPYDSSAVAIYRDDDITKLVGYIPRGENRELYEYIMALPNKKTPAAYKIWRQGDKLYGIVYIYCP
ncbi:HIRAN domain-containing protein [uncultured Bacteroides sp.]|uniref:HIRAN domain-containing protein n=1 Tax=uncultured Bacteroides sp. TaxID=162156 RepID=UPI0025914A4F|nr:HIRAN domain-containing protein [uncultured Bacteroides sp.]